MEYNSPVRNFEISTPSGSSSSTDTAEYSADSDLSYDEAVEHSPSPQMVDYISASNSPSTDNYELSTASEESLEFVSVNGSVPPDNSEFMPENTSPPPTETPPISNIVYVSANTSPAAINNDNYGELDKATDPLGL